MSAFDWFHSIKGVAVISSAWIGSFHEAVAKAFRVASCKSAPGGDRTEV